MNRSLTIVFALFSVLPNAIAQNYGFSPSNEVFGTLEMEMYTEHYMYISHDSQDSAYITWRVVGNTCPQGWDIQACDYQHCYTGLPNDGHMNAVPPGGQGYLRMIVNPFEIAGSGTLHFLIFPTGQQLDYVEAFFYFTTTALNTDEVQTVSSEKIVVLRDEVMYSGPILGDYILYGVDGSMIQTGKYTGGAQSIAIRQLAAGTYILKTPQGNRSVFFKPH